MLREAKVFKTDITIFIEPKCISKESWVSKVYCSFIYSLHALCHPHLFSLSHRFFVAYNMYLSFKY